MEHARGARMQRSGWQPALRAPAALGIEYSRQFLLLLMIFFSSSLVLPSPSLLQSFSSPRC